MSEPTLLLLRHGEVASHEGDVPVTERGLAEAVRAGKAIAAAHRGQVMVLHGGTRRTRETAEALATGFDDPARVSGPVQAFALRNPDIYVCGVRVDLVSSATALAAQIPGMTEEDATANAFFAAFVAAPDRIGWWLEHPSPPGETAQTVVDRMVAFARSLADPGPSRGRLVVGITHSPVVRAVLKGATGDSGEPRYLTGARLTVLDDGTLDTDRYDPLDD